ncbi:hypothetical protein BB560_001616 [Smittium megazygosporum]|uniref:RING-type domain-containing protein n=1 Tax=Smittium megazygosporum TaxID=133381 RepID=A0A2T9ZH32_9FUNG|nr:hypothetical protein BB560_001616 [Smittium megazygosporum]
MGDHEVVVDLLDTPVKDTNDEQKSSRSAEGAINAEDLTTPSEGPGPSVIVSSSPSLNIIKARKSNKRKAPNILLPSRSFDEEEGIIKISERNPNTDSVEIVGSGDERASRLKKIRFKEQRMAKSSADIEAIPISDPKHVPLVESATSKRRATFKCMVCLERPVNSIVLKSCGHVFCEKCILMSMKTTNKCPVCRKTIPKNSIVSFQFYLKPKSSTVPSPVAINNNDSNTAVHTSTTAN